jgi:DNA-binding GntR family transcriptional regulator
MTRQRDQRDAVVTRLRSQIVAGRYKPGEMFSQNQIADEFGVSRTPVREAVALLVKEGLLDQIPQVGLSVHEFTNDELDDLIKTRHMIETHVVARLAGKPPSNDDVEALNRLMDDMRSSAGDADHAKFLEADAMFHSEIARRAHFFLAAEIVASMGDKIRLVGLKALSRPGGTTEVIAEHDAVLKAIVKRDPKGAALAMEEHLQRTTNRILGEPREPTLINIVENKK